MTNLVIPMAGLGSRFTEAGYSTAKPLLPIHESLMYQVVLGNLFSPQLSSISIVAPVHFELADTFGKKGMSIGGIRIRLIEIDYLTDGPARTVSIALEDLEDDVPVLIANSDQYVELNSDDLYQRLIKTRARGVIVAMEDDDPKWSFARVDDDGYVVEVAEKRVISRFATAGIYGFASASILKEAIAAMEVQGDRTNGELYVAPAYNYLGSGSIPAAELINLGPVGDVMHGLGVPADYESFLTKSVSRHASNVAKALFQN